MAEPQNGRIGGGVLKDNLLRQGVDLNFKNTSGSTALLHLDVNNAKISINTDKHFRYGGAGNIDWNYFNEIKHFLVIIRHFICSIVVISCYTPYFTLYSSNLDRSNKEKLPSLS